MADGVTIPIKGDISNLNKEIEKAKNLIDSTNVELYKNEKKLYEVKKQRVEQDTRYINVLSNYKKQLSDGIISEEQYANKLKKLNDIRKESQQNIILEEKQIRNVIASNKQRIAVQEKLISVEAIYSRTQKEAQATNKITLEQLKKQIIEEKNLENIKSKRTATSIQKSSFSKETLGEMKKYYGEREKYEKDFVNSSAQNKYNDAIARLNDLQTRGIITTKEKEKALQSQKKILDENTNSTSNLANQTIRYLRWAGTIAGVVYAANRAWDMTLGKGIEVNKIIESNTYGIAALVSANTQMIDTYGNALTPLQKFTMGQEHAKIAIEQIRKESIKTAATFPQLLEIYQQGIGKTLSMGDAFGLTTKQIEENTIKLASRMSNFSNAIGMPMDRVREEMRSLVSGNASTDSLISTIIFGSPSDANKAVGEAEKRTNGLAELLDIKFKPFDILADTKTFEKSILTIQDSWQRAMGDMVQKSGMFKDITNAFYDMSKEITENTDGIVEKFDSFYNTTKSVVSALDEIVIAVTAIYASRKALSAISFVMDDMDIKTKGATSSMKLFGASLWALTKANAPLLAISAAIAAIAYNDNKMEQYANNMSDKYRDMYESRVKESKTQEENLRLIKEYSNVLGITYDRLSTSKNLSDSEKTIAEQQVKVLTEQLDILGRRSDLSNDELKKVDELFKVNKSLGELQANFAVNDELLKKTKEEVFKDEGKIVELQKEKVEISEQLLKNTKEQQRLQDQLKTKTEDPNSQKAISAAIAKLREDEKTWREGISVKDKEIAEVRQKQWEKDIAQTEARTKKIQKQNEEQAQSKAIELEIAALMSNTYDSETYKTDMTKLRVETLIEEYKALNEGITKQETLRDILKAQLEYEKAITDQNNKQNSFKNIKTYIDTNGLDMGSLNQLEEGLRITFEEDSESLNGIDKFIEQAKKKLYKEDFALEIKFTGFDDISNGIAQIGNSFQDMQKEALKYNEILKDKDASPLKKKQAQLDYADATISGYANMIGALGNFYDEDDSRRKKQQELANAFHMAKMAMQISEMVQSTAFTSLFVTQEAVKAQAAGATAVATAAQSSPWTGFATAAAMMALLASIGIALGGKTKESISSDAFSSMKENEGTGSILGDTSKQSESIVNALGILEDFAEPQFQTLLSMNKYLETIANNIGGMTSLLIQQGGFAFGEGYTGFSTEKQNIELGSGLINIMGTITNPMNVLSKISPLLGGKDMVGGIINKALGGLFGKTSVKQTLTDSGIYFANQLLTNAIEDFNGSAYQTIKTKTTKKSWFGSSSKTKYNSYYEALDDELENQFSLVLSNMYSVVLEAGKALDSAEAETAKNLEKFVVSIGKISLKGKTGDEIQEQLQAVFGKVGDDIAKTTFPMLTPFQKVGEGMFETLTRVAKGMEEAEYYIDRLGKSFIDLSYTEILNKQGDVGFEALLQSIVKTDEEVNGLDNNLVKIIESLDSTAEELYGAYTALDGIRNIFRFLKTDIETLSFASIRGAGSLESLVSGIQGYTENFLTESEQLSLSTALLQNEFNKLNIAMPVGKTGFTNLINSIDKTTESGQELYGRLIVLSEGFANVADSVEESIKALEETLKEKSQTIFDGFTASISKMFDSIVGMAESTEATILGIKTSDTGNKQETIYNQFVEYNKLLSKFETAQDSGDMKTAEKAYSSLLGLSTTLSQSGYQTEIVGLLEDKLAGFNSTKDVLRVNIVDGLGSLISLTEEQTNQLQLAAKDGAVTNTELSSIAGLTETQISSIKEFANNSNYFSTEDTLSKLGEYASAQLEILKQTQAAEKEEISKKTFTAGDYIGTQEKIDISKLLGVSYDTAAPLVKNIQGMDNLTSEQVKSQIASLVGYKTGATSYDTSVASQIEKLSSYLGTNVSSALSSIKSEATGNLAAQQSAIAFAKAKQEWQGRYLSANNIYAEEKAEADKLKQVFDTYYYNAGRNGYTTTHKGNAYLTFKDYGFGFASSKDNALNISIGAYEQLKSFIQKQQGEASSYSSLINELLAEKKIKGFSTGGYTGNIPTNAIAGFVHGQEYVLDSNATSQINSVGSVTDMVSRYTATNGFTKELNDIKNVLLDQSRYFNGIISELKAQIRILTESRDIQNESLVVLEAIEEVA